MKATIVSDALPEKGQAESLETRSDSSLQSLTDLRHALLPAKGAGFSLFIAVCNQPDQRNAAIQALERSLPSWIWARADVRSDSASVLATARKSLESSENKAAKPNALMLVGLEQAVRSRPGKDEPDESQPAIEGLNLERDAWRRDVPIPVVFWTSDFLLPLLARHAPDFLDWRSGTVLFPAEASTDIEVALDEKKFDDHDATALTPEMRRARLRELEDRIARFDSEDTHLADIQAQWLEEAAGHAARLGEPARAEQLMEQALKVWRSAGKPREEARALRTQGRAWLAAGDLLRAQALFRNALEITERLARQDPSNAQWQRDLGVSHSRLGDVQQAQGDLVGALASFLTNLEIRERLARQDPSNAQWQRDLGLCHERLGDVQREQGDLAGALASFRKRLEIGERLARQDPSNAQWQRGLGLSHSRLGEVQQAQGDLAGALASFRKYLEITERLARQDPSNAQWQRDVWVSYWKIADALEKNGDGSSGDWWQKALTQLSEMKGRGLFVSPRDERFAEFLRQKAMKKAPEAAP